MAHTRTRGSPKFLTRALGHIPDIFKGDKKKKDAVRNTYGILFFNNTGALSVFPVDYTDNSASQAFRLQR